MGLWSRSKPKGSVEVTPPEKRPIDELCESLTERWWEWIPTRSEGGQFQNFTSPSGVVVQVASSVAFIGYQSFAVCGIPYPDNHKVVEATQTCLIRRLTNKKARFSDTALALAKAVQEGDHTAAIGLADWVKENLGETQ